MQMFAGHHAADAIDVTTIEGRTAATTRMAMLQEQIRRCSAAAMRAKAMGKTSEALRLQHEAQELGMRIRALEGALACTSPLAGFSGYGAAMQYGKTADAELKSKQEKLDKATSAVVEIDKSIKKLIDEITSFKKQLASSGTLALGKKSYLRDEIEGREKSVSRLRDQRKDKLKAQESAKKEVEKALALAKAPGQVAARLDDTIDELQKREQTYLGNIKTYDGRLRDYKADLDRAGALDFAKKNYIKDQISSTESARSRAIKDLEDIRKKIRDLSAELGKAKTYAQAKDRRAVAGLPTAVVVKGGAKAEIVRAKGGVPVTSLSDKVRVDGMNKQLSVLTQELRGANDKIRDGVKAGKDANALLILINKARQTADTIRDVTFQRDTLTLGKNGARAARVRDDQARVVGTELQVQAIQGAKMNPTGKLLLLRKLNEYLKGARAALEASKKEISSVAAGRVRTLPKLKQINPSALSNQKRQLSLKASAKAPSSDMLKMLSEAFAAAVPPIKGESPEDYVLRLKRYVARGAVVAVNTQADGKPAAEAVKEAVKDVVVKDAPAIEEEARMKVTAPAGEEAVATAVNAAEATIVQAAISAAPETMAEAAESPSDAAAAEIIATPADANATPASASEVIANISDVSVPGEKKEGESTELATREDTEASRVDDEVKPWYMRPSGMALIGIGVLIGYKALTSKE